MSRPWQRPFACDDDAGEIDAGYVALEGCRVADGAAVVCLVEVHAEPLDKREVRVVAGEREDDVVRDRLLACRGAEGDGVFVDLFDGGVEVRGDLAVFDAVVDVGQDPILNVPVHLGAAVDQGDAGAVTPEFEGGDGG